MRINPQNIISSKCTIINKLKKADSATGVDVWYKHELYDCFWDVISQATQAGQQTYLGATKSVQIPANQGIPFAEYELWAQGNMDSHFTVSPDDYIVLGEVHEDINAGNIVSVMNKYGDKACRIKVFNNLDFTKGVETKGFLQRYANIYYVEGV